MKKLVTLFKNIFSKKRMVTWIIIGTVIGCISLLKVGNTVMTYTSTDKYCMSCHIHPQADQSWKLSIHHKNRSGVSAHCVDCHLPPKGHGYLPAKVKHGLKDAYGFYFKDSAKINWEEKRTLEKAKDFVYEASCLKCHENLFPVSLSTNGSNAHLSYISNKENLSCLNCHLNVGHFDKNAQHEHNKNFGVNASESKEIFMEATQVERFENFTEKIPGTGVSFSMVAIPEGVFSMGSPNSEPLRREDEGPLHKVKVSRFWMGKVEVSWDEYLAFFKATSSQGRTEGEEIKTKNVDAISGPTPPWGAPDQGWGKGSRPAITMTWHAANVYCEWLSKVTGKKYRLPTEAEWEFACRGGTSTPYFFEGDPKKFTSQGFFRKIFGPDTANINSMVVYKENSPSKTQEPKAVKANPFGLINMLGNVTEFCSDYYSPDYYKLSKGKLMTDPKGPRKGVEHVIRGGSFKSDARDVRNAARDFTKTTAWLVTDPQIPKSIWWYSDCIDIGFRVVCEVEETIEK